MTSKYIIKALTALCLLVSVAFSLVCCKQKTEDVEPIPNVYIYNSSVRVARFETPQLSKGILTACLAKNESEAMQFVLNFPAEKKNVKVVMSTLENDDGETLHAELYRQQYLSAHTTEDDSLRIYPDLLVPMFDGSDGGYKNDLCNMAASENQGYWISVTSAFGQKEGIYKGKVTITFNGGSRIIPIEVEVWGFTLPQTPSMQTAYDFCFDSENGCTGFFQSNVDGVDMLLLKKEFYEFQLKYKLSTGTLPISYDGTAAEIVEKIRPYAEDPRVTSFSLPYKTNSKAKPDKWNTELYNALLEAGLEKKAYYIPVSDASEEEISRMASQIKEYMPQIPLLTAVASETQANDTLQCVDRAALESSSDVYSLVSQNVRLWWNETGSSPLSLPLYSINTPLLSARLLRWIQKDYGISGELYYSTTNFGGNLQSPVTALTVLGDGTLCYPGLPNDGVVGRLMFMPSIRLEAVRDGIEDYEYLSLIESKLKKSMENLGITELDIADVMKIYTTNLYTSLDDYESDPQKLLAMRKTLASDIMQQGDEIVTLLPSYNENDAGSTLLTVFTKNLSEVFADGKQLVAKDMGTYYKYTLLYRNTEGQEIKVKVNGAEYTRILPKQNDSKYILKFKEKAIDNAVKLGVCSVSEKAADSYGGYIDERDGTLPEDNAVFSEIMTVINQELNAEIPALYFVSRVSLRDFKITVYAPANAEVLINDLPCVKTYDGGTYALYEAEVTFTSTPRCYFELCIMQNGEKETTTKVFDRRDIE